MFVYLWQELKGGKTYAKVSKCFLTPLEFVISLIVIYKLKN